ncbi:MAG: AGE family epimerase/isomerase [Candidatus Sumerlaeota bacterium]|nr:AGE family epimerase/isomerase [Candidatus Sumerlaeota bacterium]
MRSILIALFEMPRLNFTWAMLIPSICLFASCQTTSSKALQKSGPPETASTAEKIRVTPAAAAAAAQIASEMETHFRKGSLDIWFPRIVDKECGGFLCDFDYQWQPSGAQNKMIVFQARQTWLASKAALLYPKNEDLPAAAGHGFRFLRDVMWDNKQGGFYWVLDRGGWPTANTKSVKHAYGISFGIYGCAAYHHLTHSHESLELGVKAFRWLDEYGHDTEHGGYFEYFDRDGKIILDKKSNPTGGASDMVGNRFGYKSMNTHIHLLEAFTELYKEWPDPILRKRLKEIFLIVRDKITVAPGAMHLFFHADWTPVPDHDSYGHDVETAYLLIEAAEALGMADDARTEQVAKSLVDHALDCAWDSEKGGLRDGGSTFGTIFNKDKVWWVQAEMMNALLLMAVRYPNDPRGYFDLFRKEWSYIQTWMIDAKNGEWYSSGLDAGGNERGAKSSGWKCGYHNGRALMNCIRTLRAMESK